jgi:hypothetical protein
MNGGSGGSVLPQKILKFEARKCHFLHSEIQVCSKIYALKFEIKEGRKCTKSKKEY